MKFTLRNFILVPMILMAHASTVQSMSPEWMAKFKEKQARVNQMKHQGSPMLSTHSIPPYQSSPSNITSELSEQSIQHEVEKAIKTINTINFSLDTTTLEFITSEELKKISDNLVQINKTIGDMLNTYAGNKKAFDAIDKAYSEKVLTISTSIMGYLQKLVLDASQNITLDTIDDIKEQFTKIKKNIALFQPVFDSIPQKTSAYEPLHKQQKILNEQIKEFSDILAEQRPYLPIGKEQSIKPSQTKTQSIQKSQSPKTTPGPREEVYKTNEITLLGIQLLNLGNMLSTDNTVTILEEFITSALLEQKIENINNYIYKIKAHFFDIKYDLNDELRSLLNALQSLCQLSAQQIDKDNVLADTQSVAIFYDRGVHHIQNAEKQKNYNLICKQLKARLNTIYTEKLTFAYKTTSDSFTQKVTEKLLEKANQGERGFATFEQVKKEIRENNK